MQEQEQTKTGETLVVEYRRTTSPVSVRNTETENVSVNSSGEYDEFGGLNARQNTGTAKSEKATQSGGPVMSPQMPKSTSRTSEQALTSSEYQSTSGAEASSVQRKTWSARLRDKLEKREKDAAAAAAQHRNEDQQEKKIRTERPISALIGSAKPVAKKTPGAQKKSKHRLHQHHLGTNTPSENMNLTARGMVGGQRPTQGKSTSYHLTPSLLEDVLNEKKMSLMRSPEVIEHLQILQRNVSINRLLATAPAVKVESEAVSTRVKSESNPHEHEGSHQPPNTIGHVMVLNIKKEGDHDDGDEHISNQLRTDLQSGRLSEPPGAKTCGQTDSQGQSVKDQSDAGHKELQNFDDAVNNPLDLTAYRSDSYS